MGWSVQEEDALLVPISAVQHGAYCPRQCALIHVEQTFDENVFTLRGRRVHQAAHVTGSESLDGVRVERGLRLRSERLGLVGQADVVEFDEHGTPFPVEYKHGRVKRGRARLADELQLCAQAFCLEEMLGVNVPLGAIFYHSSRRRVEVEMTAELREETERAVEVVRDLLITQTVPPPINDARCRDCSLYDACLPDAVENFGRHTSRFIRLFEVDHVDT